MIPEFYHFSKNRGKIDGFSIIIPSWNNLKYLSLCLQSIYKYSFYNHQIIVAINEGSDGTEKFCREKDLDYVYFKNNAGVCFAVNACRTIAISDWLMYMNDDMFVLPGWDLEIFNFLKKINTKAVMVSATLIEPLDTKNPCVIVKNFGTTYEEFSENDVVNFAKENYRENWTGAAWPPVLVHKEIWDLVGGFSIEFSPGFYSDPDFSAKLYMAGVTEFIGLGNSLVYHFGTKSTKRVTRNDGKNLFLLKWGLTASDFYRKILNLGNTNFTKINLKPTFSISQRLKYMIKSLAIPLKIKIRIK
jgi:glycosyltransferase involved in cell wall biosynthesis